jgi:branched-subunit amino acid aminotransferase/4-amino-4-deoxychorismate lyase
VPTFQSLLEAFNEREALQSARSDPLAQGAAWIEGEIVPIDEARIPLMDQGFLHSDLTYDVPGVWNGRYFRLDDHLDRLEASCAKLRMRLPVPKAQLREIMIDLVAKSGIKDAYIQAIVTRGLTFLRSAGSMDESAPNLYCYVIPYVWILSLDRHAQGGAAVVTRTVRRTPPGAMDPTIKNLQWGDLMRAIIEGVDRGVEHHATLDDAGREAQGEGPHIHYPILPDGDGNVTEGAGYNIFIVKNGVLHTPRRGVLEGITRRTVFEIAQTHGLEVHVEEVPLADLYTCDELFMCSTAGGVMPLTALDGQPVGDGKVGPITRQIWEDYWALHDDPRHSFAVDYG